MLIAVFDNAISAENGMYYLKRLVSEGATLLTVDVEGQERERAARALSDAGATRVIGSEE